MAQLNLSINADSAADLTATISALALALGGTVAADPKPAATRTTKTKTEPAKQDTAAQSDAGTATESGTTTGSTGPTATSDASPSDPEALRNATRALGGQYGAVAGATALQELFKEQGSANGKLSEVTDDKMAALHARLTDLLAAQA